MDITSCICVYNKHLESLNLSDATRSRIVQLALNLFRNASEKADIEDIDKLVDLYASEIVDVVASNKQDVNVCKDYTKFAISKIIEKVKEK